MSPHSPPLLLYSTTHRRIVSSAGGDGGFSMMGTALAVIFVVSFVVLFAELYYLVWRRRVIRQKTHTVGGDHLTTQCPSGAALSFWSASSKELFYYYLCLRSNSRLDRNSIITPPRELDSKQQSDIEAIDVDMLKIQSVFGPPRFLFTIKEEEEEAEDLDSPAEQKEGEKIDHDSSLEEVEERAPVVAVEIEDATPFATPSASPVYFTPSASPAREEVNVR